MEIRSGGRGEGRAFRYIEYLKMKIKEIQTVINYLQEEIDYLTLSPNHIMDNQNAIALLTIKIEQYKKEIERIERKYK